MEWISSWLRRIADALRIEQRAKTILQQIDKIQCLFDIG
jgi:hypothetical protein